MHNPPAKNRVACLFARARNKIACNALLMIAGVHAAAVVQRRMQVDGNKNTVRKWYNVLLSVVHDTRCVLMTQ
jgi:hypothetical protein